MDKLRIERSAERSTAMAEIVQLLKTALDNEVDDRVRAELEVERLQAELAAVDEALDEFFVSNTEDHGVYRLRSELRDCQAKVKQADNTSRILSIEVEHLRSKLAIVTERDGLRTQVERLYARIRELQEIARCAKALAALVTPELAVSLEWLSDRTTQVILETACAYGLDHPLVMQQNMQVKTARELAARIREILGKGKES